MLKQQFPYSTSWKKAIVTATTIALFVAALLIFLQPFDTNEHQAQYKSLLLSGYGSKI